MSLIRFLLWSAFIALILFSFGEIIENILHKVIFIDAYPMFILFFFFITMLSYLICAFGLKKSADSSVFIMLGSVVVKLLLSMVFALIFIYGNRFDKIGFLISFFLPYFVYSGFEIYSLMYNLRALKK
jgi:hypothetical protein